MPLLDLCRYNRFDENQRVLLLSCGMFNQHLHALVNRRLINLHLLPDTEVLNRIERTGADIGYFILDSMETYYHRFGRFCVRPAAVNGSRFRAISEFAKAYFLNEVKAPDVLIISRNGEHEGHGSTTRDIPNVVELSEALTAEGYTVQIRSLEGNTLADQISLFHAAKIVIAQHGSSLANLVWMQPDKGSVVEIVPPDFRKDGWQYFEILAETMKISRREIAQKSPFSPVDVSAVLDAVRKL